jgi:hypothetical protein
MMGEDAGLYALTMILAVAAVYALDVVGGLSTLLFVMGMWMAGCTSILPLRAMTRLGWNFKRKAACVPALLAVLAVGHWLLILAALWLAPPDWIVTNKTNDPPYIEEHFDHRSALTLLVILLLLSGAAAGRFLAWRGGLLQRLGWIVSGAFSAAMPLVVGFLVTTTESRWVGIVSPLPLGLLLMLPVYLAEAREEGESP